jgi:hypothetical protein
LIGRDEFFTLAQLSLSIWQIGGSCEKIISMAALVTAGLLVPTAKADCAADAEALKERHHLIN